MPLTRQEAKEIWERAKDPDAFPETEDEITKTYEHVVEELIDAYAEGRCACCYHNRPSQRCP